MKPHFPSLCASLLALSLAASPTARATIGLTLAGYTNDFSVNTTAGDWITSSSNIGGADTNFTTEAEVDTFVITNSYNAAGLTTTLGTSATDPPSANVLARRNTTLEVLQMRPTSGTAKSANVLVLRLRNDSGAVLPQIDVAYDFAEAVAGTEEIPGWQAYFSVTGNSDWVKIPEFSGGTSFGLLSASLNVPGGWAPGELLHILWIDDNAAAADEAAYTMDNISVTVPVTSLITAVISNTSRSPGGDVFDPSDDTVTFDVTIDGTNLPPGTPGWTTTGGSPTVVTGTYGQTVNVPDVPVSALPLTITLADRSNAGIVGEFTMTTGQLPPYVALDATVTPAYVKLDAASAAQWVADPGALTLQQANGGGTVAFDATTEPVTLAAGSGKYVRLVLEVQDTSAGTNFETEDTLKIDLVTDAGTVTLTRHMDRDQNGFVNGFSDSVDAPYDTTPLADEFNRAGLPLTGTFTNVWHLHGAIPAAATTAHLLFSGVNNSATEAFRVRDVVFGVSADTDGDGVPDSLEQQADTDASNAADFLRVTAQTFDGTTFTATVLSSANRTYQLETSDDLVTWLATGTAQDGTGAELTLSTPLTGLRKFVRVAAQ